MDRNRGITLIALVITIIVLLILAGISITMLSGDNGLLNRTTEARSKTIHANVYDQLQLEELAYLSDKTTSKTSSTLIEYLQSKSIIGNEIGEDTGKYQVNVTALLGSRQSLGNGNATVELKDVYMLEKQSTSTGNIVNTKVATTTPIKIAATSTTQITYKVLYYGNGISETLTLGNLSNDDNTTVVASDESTKLYEFYKTKNFEFVETTQSIDGKNSEYIFSNFEAYCDYVLYNGKMYKVSYESTNITVTSVELASGNFDSNTFGEYTIDGKKVLVTPSTSDHLVHTSYEGPDTYYKYNETTEEYDIPFTGYCASDSDGYDRYYDTSGALVRVDRAK